MNLLSETIRKICGYIGEKYPKEWITLRYFLRFHKPIHWKYPRNLNEKILYLSIFTDTSKWTELADKFSVRKYVTDCGYKDSLVELYGVWKNANDIDFNQLPKQFVMKTNHGSGEIKVIKNKSLIDKKQIIDYFNKAVATPYGAIEAGMHYLRIKPCIIAEQLLVNDIDSQKYSSSIIDYKCWCFNGKVYYIWVCCNRDSHGTDVLLYDRDWNVHIEYSIFTKHYRRGEVIPRPANLSEMINIAEDLAHPFPCVRVDLYNIGRKIYFGEMTFTSLGGLMNFFTDEFLRKAGDLIDLNYKG